MLFGCAGYAFAQSAAPDVEPSVRLGEIEYIIDTDGGFTIEEVVGGEFQSLPSAEVNFGITRAPTLYPKLLFGCLTDQADMRTWQGYLL